MDILINIFIEITTKISNCSLNSLWLGLGITDISFLRLLQIIFFAIFLVLNICLIYIEYLDKKSKIKDNSKYLQSGPTPNSAIPHLKRYSAYFLAGAAALSSMITIKNEVLTLSNNAQALETYTQNYEKIIEAKNKIIDQKTAENMYNRLNIGSAHRTLTEAIIIRDERSELQKSISKDLEKYKETGDKA